MQQLQPASGRVPENAVKRFWGKPRCLQTVASFFLSFFFADRGAHRKEKKTGAHARKFQDVDRKATTRRIADSFMRRCEIAVEREGKKTQPGGTRRHRRLEVLKYAAKIGIQKICFKNDRKHNTCILIACIHIWDLKRKELYCDACWLVLPTGEGGR